MCCVCIFCVDWSFRRTRSYESQPTPILGVAEMCCAGRCVFLPQFLPATCAWVVLVGLVPIAGEPTWPSVVPTMWLLLPVSSLHPCQQGPTLPYCSPLLHIRWLTSHRASAGLRGDHQCEHGVPLPAALELTGEADEVGQAHPRVRSAHFSWLTVQNTCLSVIHRHLSAFGWYRDAAKALSTCSLLSE